MRAPLRRMRTGPAVVALVVLAGCTSAPARLGLGLPAPNPNGCYVFVFDQSDWRGAGVALNGPGRWPILDGLPGNQENWRNRIRSMEVGPAAVVTVYSDPTFAGVSRTFAASSKLGRLDSELSARIESLDLSCLANGPETDGPLTIRKA